MTAKIIEHIDWNVEDGHYLAVELKKIILTLAESIDHPETVAEAQRRYSSWRDHGTHIDGNLLLIVLSSVLSRSEEEDSSVYESVLQHYNATCTVDGQEICLRALGRVRSPALVTRLAKLSVSPVTSLQNAPIIATALGRNPVARPVVWEYMKSHWTEIQARLSTSDAAFVMWVQDLLIWFADGEFLEDMESFFQDKEEGRTVLAKGLNIVRESVRRDARFKSQQGENLRIWLEENGLLI